MKRYTGLQGTSHNFRRVGHLDIPGGGQVTVSDGYAYVGHLKAPHGTSIIDVSDPSRPRVTAEIPMVEGLHSHKVRVHDSIMLVNNERYRTTEQPEVGLRIYNVADRSKPREIAFFECAGTGVHRFDFDGTYAYISAEMPGFRGNIVVILDMHRPEKPEEVGRWWLPGQWIDGGEQPTWEGTRHRCHHPLRFGNRLYTSYWHAGFMILDIDDMSNPTMLSHVDWSPPYACPTHTALAVPHDIKGRRWMIVTDEDIEDRLAPEPNGWFWMVDITDETNPVPVSTWSVPKDALFDPNEWFGAHQPQEQIYEDNLVAVTWFSGGLRLLDISDPYRPREVAWFVPTAGPGETMIHSNDVYADGNGLYYLIDRFNGLDILEYTG